MKYIGIGLGIGTCTVGAIDLLVAFTNPTGFSSPVTRYGMIAVGALFVLLGLMTIHYYTKRKTNE